MTSFWLKAGTAIAACCTTAVGQVCGGSTTAAKDGAACQAGVMELKVPFAAAALWAASKVPSQCDQQEGSCNWAGAGDAWRYIVNNLRLAAVAAGLKDVDVQLKEVHSFMQQLGQNPGMWYGNWPTAAGQVRAMLGQLQPWLDKAQPTQVALPSANIGTHFPTLGRSVAVPSDGSRGLASSVALANGFAMPVLGFGVWQIPADGTTYQSVKWALELGYRHIDTAQGYGNEQEVGLAMRDSGVPREQICLVTKLSVPGQYATARQTFEDQLRRLQVDYIDIYMLHSPGRSLEERKLAWAQLEELYDEGKIKALGVSNFDVGLLQELLSFARIRPVYIQNKYSIYQPGNSDEALKGESLMEWLAREKIVMTGYSTIHPGHGGYLSPLEDPHVLAIAKRHERTPAQVLHRWLLQLGAAVIPRSTKYKRIQENGDLFRFALPEAEMRLLNGIASLVKSAPGQPSPIWCEDVYSLTKF